MVGLIELYGKPTLLNSLIPEINLFDSLVNSIISQQLSVKVVKNIKGKLKNKFTGTVGKFGCLSFNGNKIITTGGGGMLLTDDKKLAKKAKYLVSQAKDNNRYIHNDVGYNFRLTNIQAALGLAQLENFKKFKKKKNQIHIFYKSKNFKINGL